MYMSIPILNARPKTISTKVWRLKELMGALRGPQQFEPSDDGMSILIMGILRIPR